MMLLTPELRAALRENDIARSAALCAGQREPDPAPVVKFFNPIGAATWLASELAADGDTLFGLADLGFGCPELGSFSLSEIASVRLSFGLGIERDITFEGLFPLSLYADAASLRGSILEAERALRAMAAALGDTDPELPPPSS
jgi:hypothetical protein